MAYAIASSSGQWQDPSQVSAGELIQAGLLPGSILLRPIRSTNATAQNVYGNRTVTAASKMTRGPAGAAFMGSGFRAASVAIQAAAASTRPKSPAPTVAAADRTCAR